jgi:DNA-binding beta-propeller fold protein YncE
MRKYSAAVLAFAVMAAGAATAHAEDALKLVSRTSLDSYTGDFDHFGVDLPGNRLFLAAEDHGTLEVFNLKTGAHEKTVKGPIETPHSIFYIPARHKLLVTDTGKGMTKVLDSRTYKAIGNIPLTVGADSIGYDAPRNRLYVVTGGKDVDMKTCYLEEIDPDTGKALRKLEFDSNHTEAMAVEQHGDRIFINVTDKNYLAVVDKKTLTVTARWTIKEARQNAPIAMDEANHRLFVVTRDPGKVVVLNSDTGETVAAFEAPGRADEAVWDAGNRRLYVPGGEGYIGVYEEQDPDHFVELPHVASGAGAKTEILIPQLKTLYVAESAGDAVGGAVLKYDVADRK